MRRKVDSLIPNEKRFLIAGLDFKLEGKERFWTREILQRMDLFRSDDQFTGTGTLVRIVNKFEEQELINVYKNVKRPNSTRPRTYYELTELGVSTASMFVVRHVLETSETLDDLVSTMRGSNVGQFILSQLLEKLAEE